MRSAVILGCLSVAILAALAWHLTRRNLDQEQLIRRLAWSVRRSDQGQLLNASQRAFLQGDFAEALRHLGKPSTAGDRELQSALFLCLIHDLPWPQQLLAHKQLDSAPAGRPRLLARVVQSGYASEADRVRLEFLGWTGQRLETLRPELKSPQSLGKNDDWAAVSELIAVHLDRKDTKQSQLWAVGQTRGGRQRLEVVHGFSRWQRWVLVTDQPVRRLADRIKVSAQQAYKLVDDEWIEVR
jgi:hypothetical protein